MDHLLQWLGMKQPSSKLLTTIIDKEENFSFRVYAFDPTRIHMVQIFNEVIPEVYFVPRLLVSAKA